MMMNLVWLSLCVNLGHLESMTTKMQDADYGHDVSHAPVLDGLVNL